MTKVNDTKCKIINVALKLFGCKGYDGTSVRDIAKEADVNLASVNYHFSNKKNLYLEVFNSNCEEVEVQLSKLYQEGMSLEDFAVAMFEFYTKNSPKLLNTFRLILNENLDFSKDGSGVCVTKLGPPAGWLLLKIVTEEVGEEIPLDGRFWAVITIISHVSHMAIILSSSVIKQHCEHLKYLNKETQIRNIRLQCRSTINFLKSEPFSTWDENFKVNI
ncbi:hypothetical protein BIY24_03205 [Halobacteriovorax marinus]|uniref:TetR/AcrR family transcriptional regulator n=1 Tax=Halobacteriovorax marinus TaxID=97084 RepID=UPI000BC2E0B1|nr:TetR/AcrR family transcriptional regulator [Halobacteriovorax marinus]ATH06977.1 hypothetical protein BIY24_03205 [Halobacteriovorax marinus]